MVRHLVLETMKFRYCDIEKSVENVIVRKKSKDSVAINEGKKGGRDIIYMKLNNAKLSSYRKSFLKSLPEGYSTVEYPGELARTLRGEAVTCGRC